MAIDAASPWPGLPLGAAREEAARLLARLERNESALRLAVAGEARRMAPLVRHLHVLATAHAAAPLLEALASAPRVTRVSARSAWHVEVELACGLPVLLEVLADEQDFVPALVRATGPAGHLATLQARAAAQGLSWRGDALCGPEGRIALLEEADLYAALGLDRPIPEQREQWVPGLEVHEPVAMADMLGVAGVLTREAGGRFTVAEMATRAAREGYGWMLARLGAEAGAGPHEALAAAVAGCEHAVAADPETGLEARASVRLMVEARAAGGPHDLTSPAGTLRCLRMRPDEGAGALRGGAFDVVLLEGPAEDATDRGRLLAALASTGAALCVRPPPHHPQPEPRLLAEAVARGVPLLLLADAHDLVGLDQLVLGVGLCRRAGAPAATVLNAWPLARLEAWTAGRRARA